MKTNILMKPASILLGSSLFFLVVLSLAACHSSTDKTENASSPKAEVAPMKMADSVKHYDITMVDNKKDPSCGMPVSAGIGDTAHYKDKVLGFCSVECKAAFLKNPDAGLVAAELKK